MRRKVRVNVDTKKPVKTELPEDKIPSVKPIKKMDEHKPKCFKPGDALKEMLKDVAKVWVNNFIISLIDFFNPSTTKRAFLVGTRHYLNPYRARCQMHLTQKISKPNN